MIRLLQTNFRYPEASTLPRRRETKRSRSGGQVYMPRESVCVSERTVAYSYSVKFLTNIGGRRLDPALTCKGLLP